MSADRIAQGPPIDGVNHYDSPGALVIDALNNITETVGANRVQSADRTCLFPPLGAQTALSNVTAAQNLLSKNLNAGVLNKLGRLMVVKGSLLYTSPGTTTPTMTFAVILGGVTLCSITTAALSATASTNMPVQFEFQLQVASTGAAGTIEAHGWLNANITANTPAGAMTTYCDSNTAVSAAVNLASALTLNVTVAASSAISSVQLRLGTVEVAF